MRRLSYEETAAAMALGAYLMLEKGVVLSPAVTPADVDALLPAGVKPVDGWGWLGERSPAPRVLRPHRCANPNCILNGKEDGRVGK